MNETKPTLWLIAGLPASGKSTYAKLIQNEHDNIIVLSSDSIRKELYGDEGIQGDSQEVFNLLHKRAKEHLAKGISVVYDATNVKSKHRRAFLRSLSRVDCDKKCIIMATPYKQCLENNKKRDRVVPESVIERMYKQWNTPWYYEGFDDVEIVYSDDIRHDAGDFIDKHMKHDQHSSYHTLTLGLHCYMTFKGLYSNKYDKYKDCSCEVMDAGYIHDVGKPFVKSFTNYKGEKTEYASYYNHENCGAYDALFFEYHPCSDPLYVSLLVNLHMLPYAWERDNNEKMRLKYAGLWGEVLYRDVMAIHEADKMAH